MKERRGRTKSPSPEERILRTTPGTACPDKQQEIAGERPAVPIRPMLALDFEGLEEFEGKRCFSGPLDFFIPSEAGARSASAGADGRADGRAFAAASEPSDQGTGSAAAADQGCRA